MVTQYGPKRLLAKFGVVCMRLKLDRPRVAERDSEKRRVGGVVVEDGWGV